MIVNKQIKLALASSILIGLNFPFAARAEWDHIGDGEEGPIYLNDQSVYIKGDLRSAEVRIAGSGRAVMVINCDSYNYYWQDNYGKDEDYARPGTVAGVVADEVCENYYPTE